VCVWIVCAMEGEVEGYEMVYYCVTRYRTRKRDLSLFYTKIHMEGEVKVKSGEVKVKSGTVKCHSVKLRRSQVQLSTTQ
jgi:hypothetical protein